jgi:hypothetical protein
LLLMNIQPLELVGKTYMVMEKVLMKVLVR